MALTGVPEGPRDLDGEVILVTGAARGIGAAIAWSVAQAGADVIVSDLDLAAAEEMANKLTDQGLSAMGVSVDVTNEKSAIAGLNAAIAWRGRLTGLVNNAGILIEANVVELTEAQWDAVLDVNLKGVWRMTRLAIPLMKEAGAGAIVNISSLEGLFARPRHVAYAVSKAGLINLTRATAVDFGRYGIRCNAICPGSISTSLLEQHLEQTGEPAMARQDLIGRNFSGRLGTPEEVGETARFLLGPSATFINGTYIVIDGARGAST